jgi:hypothetical protein
MNNSPDQRGLFETQGIEYKGKPQNIYELTMPNLSFDTCSANSVIHPIALVTCFEVHPNPTSYCSVHGAALDDVLSFTNQPRMLAIGIAIRVYLCYD